MALDRVRLLRIEELAHEVQKFPGYPWVTHCYGFGELALLWTIK